MKIRVGDDERSASVLLKGFLSLLANAQLLDLPPCLFPAASSFPSRTSFPNVFLFLILFVRLQLVSGIVSGRQLVATAASTPGHLTPSHQSVQPAFKNTANVFSYFLSGS